MNKEILSKIKNKIWKGAHISATKIEEAARTGKLQITIIAEKKKLSNLYGEIGKQAYLSIQKNNTAELHNQANVQTNMQKIEVSLGRIKELEKKMST